ncbi:MAG: LamG-like jellyroll fold domain-containing protein [Saprospiraceae bacterium]
MRPIYTLLLFLFISAACALPLSAQVTCGPEAAIDTSGFSGTAFFNYGSKARLSSQKNKMALAVGQTFVGYLDGLEQTSSLGFYSRYLLPPFALALTATQGDLLDRIQLTWEIDALGPSPNDGFNIYRDGVFLANVGNNIRTYNDFNVIAGIAYNYEVRGINLYGEGAPGRAIGFQVPNGTVTGWVQTGSGSPVPDVLVALTPLQGFSAKFRPTDGAFAEQDTTTMPFLPASGSDWTLAFWMKTDSATANAGVAAFAPFPLHFRALNSGGGSEGIEVATTETGTPFLSATFPNATKNGWHHVALTYEGGQGRLYLDGILIALAPMTLLPSAAELNFGSRTGTGGWAGCLDEVRIYHRRLDELDFGEVMMGTASSLTPNLTHYWKFDEEKGVKSFDIIKRHKLYLCGSTFKMDRPNVRTMGKTNQDGYYRIESASYGTGTTFLAEAMKDFYMYRALKFERDLMDYATLPDFSVTPKATLELWVNSAGPDGEQCLLSKRWPGNDFRLLLKPNGLMNELWFYINGQEHNFGDLGMGYQHLAFTLDTTLTDNELFVTAYKNGVALGNQTFTGITGNWSDITETWMLGARPSGMGRTDHFGGLIDEIALYDTTLSAANILDHFQNPRNVQDFGLRIYFDLNEGNGNRLNNSGSVLLPYGTNFGAVWTPFAARQMTTPHEFLPKTRQVTLNPSVTSVDQVDFTDRSTIPVSGYVRYKNTDCFAKNVEILINGASFEPKVFTDSTGKFVADFAPGTTAQLTPVFEDHVFVPAFWEVTNVISPIAGILFNDITTRKVKGVVAGGLCKKSVIKAPPGMGQGTVCAVRVRSVDGCLERQIIIDNQDGEYEFDELPPIESMTVAVVEHSDPDVKAAFQVQGGSTVDLSKKDTIIDFIYFAPPEVELLGGLDSVVGCSPPVYVLEKDENVTLLIGLKEQYVPILDNTNMVIDDGVCPLDTADFRIINFIGEQVLDTAMSGSVLEYKFRVRNPNPSPPYLKSIQIVGTSLGGRTSSLVKEVVVTGIRNKENTFTTLLPEMPSVVLRDPPGDGSYAFLEENSKVCKTYTVSSTIETGGGGGLEVHLGGNVNIISGTPFVGIINNVGPIFDIGAEFQVTYQKTTDSTFQTCTSVSEKFSTDDGELVVGGAQGADIYMGEAINIVFGFADMVSFNETTCTPSVKTVLNVEPGDFPTVFMYSEFHIVNNVMRYLDSLVLDPNASSEDSARYVESKERWVQILERNAGLKEKAKSIRNISFDAGVQYEYSESVDSSFATSTEEGVNSEISLATHFGFEFNKAGFTIMLKFVANTSKSTKNENGTEKSLTTGYVLKDNDPGDAFTVDVGIDSVYKTPVFRTKAGQTSCPWEPNTAHREGNSLIFRDGSGALAENVPANEPAVFKFFFGNTSATNETWTYAFTAGPESNPHGAKISINGSPMDAPIMYAIPWGTSIPVTVELRRGPEEYEYDSLEVVLYSLCEDIRANALGILPDDDTILYSAQYISAHFIRPCSEVDINVPEQNWVVIKNDPFQPGTIRRITTSGYDLSNSDFELVRVQYRRSDGDGAWINLPGVFEHYNPNWSGYAALPNPKPPILESDFTQFFWETAGLSDGDYEIHAWAVCKGDATDKPGFSEIIKGRIDREPPSLVGVPQPSDGVLNVGDEISFTFNQPVNCDSLKQDFIGLKRNVGLYDATTNTFIGANVTCYENKIVFDQTFNNEFFENRIVRAELRGIQDLIGNKTGALDWEFFVDRNELGWLTDSLGITKFEDENKTVVANIHNRGGYPVPFKILGVPDWVHVTPNQGTLVPNEIRPVSFTIDSLLAFGHWSDTIVLETQIGQNLFFMGGSEPLPIGVRVVCRPPYGNVNLAQFENTMGMVLKVNIEGVFSTDPEDIVAVFIDDEIRGRANVQYVPQVNAWLAYLTVHGDPSDMLKPLRIEVWDASACQRYGSVVESFTFQPDNVIGIPINPQVIHTGGLLLREVPLGYGWNWISFNLAFPDNSLNAALASLKHPENDLMRSQTALSEYFGGWFGTLGSLNNTTMYIYRADVPDTLRMQGTPIDPFTTHIPVVAGWNWIGYVPDYSLPINDALASLPAQIGDIVKSQYSFAQYINPTFGWVGNLKYMSPPNGYQIKLAQAGTLTYPPPPSPLTGNLTEARGETEIPVAAHWNVQPTLYEHSNTLIGMLRTNGANATTSNMELAAFVGNEVRGIAQAIYIEPLDAHLFFLTTYANTAGEQMRFKLYDDATSTERDLTETMYFAPNQHQGSIENPVPFELQTTRTEEEIATDMAFDVQPNPFSSETTLRFNLSKAEDVTLTISDAQGREVVRRPLSAFAGPNTATWNGRSDTGSWLSSGMYTVQLKTAAGSVVRKVVLQRLP